MSPASIGQVDDPGVAFVLVLQAEVGLPKAPNWIILTYYYSLSNTVL
jgi:hypothetical protein